MYMQKLCQLAYFFSFSCIFFTLFMLKSHIYNSYIYIYMTFSCI
ncbi:hypothetical protein HMPREF3182_00456 [Megasphaera hutchinsoni]|uniref:Uncharacterized protein n=1 Tax=Megasphaera hutchinsoni TaxID=1588748 RepID=A0A134CJP3_9FIRM|nr:hypothetical protein HMPREF3182_00456 [Megasphaera hutchinsoni]